MSLMNLRSVSRILLALGSLIAFGCATLNEKSSPNAVIGEAKEGVCTLDVADVADVADAATTDDAGATSDAGTASGVPNYLSQIGCSSDFNALASVPMDTSLSGARSGKVVLDTEHDNTLYFQNSQRYQLHWDFVLENVPEPGVQNAFEQTQYYAPEADRRFMLGAITHYEGPGVWALELAAYDTATPAMIKKLFDAIVAKAFFGPALRFHPTSQSLETVAKKLDASIPVITTSELYGTMVYQPLVLATAMGQLLFFTSEEIQSGAFVPYNSIVVLDQAPNNISVVAGIISQEFQSPLSHINVLSANRKTPNMGLRNALTDETILALKGKYVRLTVGADKHTITEVSFEEAEAYYEAHKPQTAVILPGLDKSIRGLWNVEDVVPNYKSYTTGAAKRTAISSKVPAFGGKTVNYSVMAQYAELPIPKAFAIPMYYYDKFMSDNGLYDLIDNLMADPKFQSNATVRMEALRGFRNKIMKGTVDPELQAALKAKLAAEFTGTDGKPFAMRFRTSTNSEDLDAFPCAGCYESHTGDPAAGWDDVLNAIRLAYSSTWLYRTYEERDYYHVDQKSVGMSLLVHHTFQNETANGVAVTNNPFDSTGVNPAFYINVEYGGDAEVVHLPVGVTTDQFLYFYGTPNNPIQPISSSNLIPAGTSVLTKAQTYALGTALDAIHTLFAPAYGKGLAWYAMDVEFKFAPVDSVGNTTSTPQLWVKQARPYPGRGNVTTNTSND
jgi:hypothetical protein